MKGVADHCTGLLQYLQSQAAQSTPPTVTVSYAILFLFSGV